MKKYRHRDNKAHTAIAVLIGVIAVSVITAVVVTITLFVAK